MNKYKIIGLVVTSFLAGDTIASLRANFRHRKSMTRIIEQNKILCAMNATLVEAARDASNGMSGEELDAKYGDDAKFYHIIAENL